MFIQNVDSAPDGGCVFLPMVIQNVCEFLNRFGLVDIEVKDVPQGRFQRIRRVGLQMFHEIDELCNICISCARKHCIESLTPQRIWIRQSACLVCMPEVVERSNEAKDEVFAKLRRKLGQQLSFARHVRIRDCMAAEVVTQNLEEVISEESWRRTSDEGH